jgi:hypothetical protein
VQILAREEMGMKRRRARPFEEGPIPAEFSCHTYSRGHV